ncbi:hypothetical protein GJAV_G00158060 [Gymnothorax javanicus]|nr:hypothetical protein GJAV_G00158060 [Gymnothorax javanicus]
MQSTRADVVSLGCNDDEPEIHNLKNVTWHHLQEHEFWNNTGECHRCQPHSRDSQFNKKKKCEREYQHQKPDGQPDVPMHAKAHEENTERHAIRISDTNIKYRRQGKYSLVNKS